MPGIVENYLQFVHDFLLLLVSLTTWNNTQHVNYASLIVSLENNSNIAYA